MVETIVEEDGREQAEVDGDAGIELVKDLPWTETPFVGVGSSQVEVELVASHGEDVKPDR